jgi:hypothetical protein
MWYGENAPPRRFERLLPSGDVDLIINVRDAELRRYEIANLESPRLFAGPIVSGVHDRPYVIDTAQQAALLGVRFRPGCARQLLGVPFDQQQQQRSSRLTGVRCVRTARVRRFRGAASV